ncbi:hypothetical protein METBIDRAFT_153222 [Metschnikowia bicuspidata var. bicuspidata NRRL YB-4993]|uniref:Zn(2)-C6 fungal-type domain-containing protein n=1 Tax=Metschnikowia bicuspidata var. bicuspidata NRRL YB-4993 TaxID=869754 RepID=A0A1A0HEV2_9ASCO|nr:hypothetical protein METBIDRAFT_153222 [Metschnikowia bicuspidata var. bicuspidata NRRL YB-4993]OBA22417.1 hypothetical protein METBIDRAFT_153222 [Metschnikowia bicuspidata var. bicuspidata NRRL YB-4993]
MIQLKRRPRANYVCNFCKRRKVRCDKGTPCSACVKYGNPMCEYPPEPFPKAESSKTKGFDELVIHFQPASAVPALLKCTLHPRTDQPRTTKEFLSSKMHLELEFLKSKISMLEHLILGQSSGAHSPVSLQVLQSVSPYPIWQNPHGNRADLSFMLGYYPCLSDSQYFSFHNLYVPIVSMSPTVTRHFYPLSWVSLIKMYSSISPLFAMKQQKRMKEKRAIIKPETEPTGPSDRMFNMKLREFVGVEGDFNASTPPIDVSKVENLRLINQRAKAVGLTVYEGDLDSEHDILKKVTKLLPTRKVIWLLIDRFFERVYPFFPFLDQFDFEAQVALMLGSASTDHVRVEKLCILKKVEVVYLGTLLIVLRLAYLTLFTNDDAQNEANLCSDNPCPMAQQLKFLLDNPVDVDVFSVAQLCLFQFGYLRFTNIPILQLCLYLNIYNSFAPESGEGADNTNSLGFCARIIEMAQTLGLHRESDNFRSKMRNDKLNNLCRKIWWYLVITDTISGLTNGCPLSIKRSQFDTLPPYHKPGNENIKNVLLEKQVNQAFANFDTCYDLIYDVVSVISDVRAPIAMSDLCKKLSALEMIAPDMLGSVSQWLDSPNGTVPHIEVENGHTLKIGFQATFFLVSVNLHFFNHYELMGEMDLAYFYLKKILIASVLNMMPFYEKFVENTGSLFVHTTDIAITPSFQTLVHKCTIIIHCVQMRARFSIIKCETLLTHQRLLDEDAGYRRRYELLQETFALCETCVNIFLRSMKKMVSRYYYCWRYLKAQEKLKEIRNGTDYYLNWCKGKESYMLLSCDMLEDLNGILKSSIQTVQKNEVKSESASEPSYKHSHGSLGLDTAATLGSEFSTFNLNDQFSDAMWTQMLSMKPGMGNNSFYNDVPQASFPPEFMGSTYDPNSFGGLGAAGAGFYDSLFHDVMEQANEF